MLLTGCTRKVDNIEVVKVSVPTNFFQLKEIELNRSFNSQKDIAEFILDLYESYEECRVNLDSIKKWNKEINNGK